jgi:hypothetical protein
MTAPRNNGNQIGRVYEFLVAMFFSLISKDHLMSLGNGRTGFDMIINSYSGTIYGVNCKYTNRNFLQIDEYRLKKEIENLKNIREIRWDRLPKMLVVGNKEPYPASKEILNRNNVKFLLLATNNLAEVIEIIKNNVENL